MSLFVKICGISSLETALVCQAESADAIGLVFAPSPRQVSPLTAREISLQIGSSMARVGVFVDEDPATVVHVATFAQLSHVQLHGSESPEVCKMVRKQGFRVIKAFRVRSAEDLGAITEYDVDAALLDAYVPGAQGGTGIRFDLAVLNAFSDPKPILIAGGLNEANVGEVITVARPWGVDVSSGVEVNGQKSPSLIRGFMRSVRRADR